MTVVLIIIGIGLVLTVPLMEGGLEGREVRRAARQIAHENSIHTTGWSRWAVLTERAVIEQVHGGREFGEGVVQILFFPNGSTSGADVVVAGRRDRSEHRLRIALDPLLGTVRVEDAPT
jgi:hypothetical protein